MGQIYMWNNVTIMMEMFLQSASKSLYAGVLILYIYWDLYEREEAVQN